MWKHLQQLKRYNPQQTFYLLRFSPQATAIQSSTQLHSYNQSLRLYSTKAKQQQNDQQQKQPQDSTKYNYWKDERIKNILKNLALLFLMVYTSGKATNFVIKRYIMEDATQLPQLSKGDVDGQTTDQLEQQMELERVQVLKPRDLKNKAYFGRGRNYYVQFIDDTGHEKLAIELSPSFYQLKRLCRKKSQPLYTYRIYLSEFRDDIEVLAKSLGIQSIEEFKEVEAVVVNEDKMKLPIIKGDQVGLSIAFKFIQNPARINNLDDLYDAFETNKGNNIKYVVIYNPVNQKSAASMTIQQKLFRKFFYENSNFIESEVKFIEVTNSRVAQRIGLDSDDKIFVIQNQNPYSKMKDSEEFKLMNLPLERYTCTALLQSNLEKKYARYLQDLSRKEFEDFLMSEENIDQAFELLATFIEDALIQQSQIIYVQTSRMLKFFKSHFRKRLQNILFIQSPVDQIDKVIEKLKDIKADIPIILTDLKDGADAFNLLSEPNKIAIRYIDYGQLYNEKTKEIIPIAEIISNEALKAKSEKDYAHLFLLKYNLDSIDSLSQEFLDKCLINKLIPYLESDQHSNKDLHIEGIQNVNRQNYEQILKQKDFTVLEVYARKCSGCKKIDPLLLTIKANLESSHKNSQLVRVDILNEMGFLKEVDKTPCFIVYNRKQGTFHQVDTKIQDGDETIDNEDNQKVAAYLSQLISKQIKNQ